MWGFYSLSRGLASSGGWIGYQTSMVSAEIFAWRMSSVPTSSGCLRQCFVCVHLSPLCCEDKCKGDYWHLKRCAHAPYNWSKAVSKEIQHQSGIRHLTTDLCLQKMEMRSNLKMSQEKTGQTSFMIIGGRAHTVSAGQKLKSLFVEILGFF